MSSHAFSHFSLSPRDGTPRGVEAAGLVPGCRRARAPFPLVACAEARRDASCRLLGPCGATSRQGLSSARGFPAMCARAKKTQEVQLAVRWRGRLVVDVVAGGTQLRRGDVLSTCSVLGRY